MKNSMPEYKSKTYYDVVIKGKKFMGWRCPYAGDGSLHFSHPTHGSIKIGKGLSENWMQECWDDFMLFLSAKNDTRGKAL